MVKSAGCIKQIADIVLFDCDFGIFRFGVPRERYRSPLIENGTCHGAGLFSLNGCFSQLTSEADETLHSDISQNSQDVELARTKVGIKTIAEKKPLCISVSPSVKRP